MLYKTDNFSPTSTLKHTHTACTHTEHKFLLCRVSETLIGMIEDVRIVSLVTLRFLKLFLYRPVVIGLVCWVEGHGLCPCSGFSYKSFL